MQKVIDVTENQIAMKEFADCLDMCRECDCLVTLKQFMQRADNGFNQLVVDKEVLFTANTIEITGNFIYLSMTCKNAIQLKKIKNLWRTYIERGHARYMEHKGNDYALLIDLVKTEEVLGLAYDISFINPVFMGFDEGVLEIAFSMDCMNYEIANIDFVSISEEIEYTEMLNEERSGESKISDNIEDAENEDLVSNDDMLSNDDLLLIRK